MSKKPSDWWDESWNPVTGCTPCSPGCLHCWAAGMVKRFDHLHGYSYGVEVGGNKIPRSFNAITFHHDRLDKPLHWRKSRRVFVCSLGDLFHDGVPPHWQKNILRAVGISSTDHRFFLLTKRARRMRRVMTDGVDDAGIALWHEWPMPNVAIGVTVCNQEEADEKVPLLLETPAAMRFVHVEPILSEISLEPWLERVDWVVCGTENGPGKRLMGACHNCRGDLLPDISWLDWLQAQCEVLETPFWDKRPGDNRIRQRAEGW